MKPKFSIIIPLYNRNPVIEEAIKSVINQTYERWELIIVDDGSTDGSQEVIQHLLTDTRIKFIQRKKEPKGPSSCRNIGLKSASGQFAIFLDSDDLLMSNCLESRNRHIEHSGGFDLYVFNALTFYHFPGDSNTIFNKKPEQNETYLDLFLKAQTPWQTTASTWNTDYLTSLGGWNEDFLIKTDPELHIRAILKHQVKLKIFENSDPDYYFRLNSLDSDKQTYFTERTIKYWSLFFKHVYKLIINYEGKWDKKKLKLNLKKGALNFVKQQFFTISDNYEAQYDEFIDWCKSVSFIPFSKYMILKTAHYIKCRNIVILKRIKLVGVLYRLV